MGLNRQKARAAAARRRSSADWTKEALANEERSDESLCPLKAMYLDGPGIPASLKLLQCSNHICAGVFSILLIAAA